MVSISVVATAEQSASAISCINHSSTWTAVDMVVAHGDSGATPGAESAAQLGAGASASLEQRYAALDLQTTPSKDYKHRGSSTLVSLMTMSGGVLNSPLRPSTVQAASLAKSSTSQCSVKVLCSFGDDCLPSTVEIESAPPKVTVVLVAVL